MFDSQTLSHLISSAASVGLLIAAYGGIVLVAGVVTNIIDPPVEEPAKVLEVGDMVAVHSGPHAGLTGEVMGLVWGPEHRTLIRTQLREFIWCKMSDVGKA